MLRKLSMVTVIALSLMTGAVYAEENEVCKMQQQECNAICEGNEECLENCAIQHDECVASMAETPIEE